MLVNQSAMAGTRGLDQGGFESLFPVFFLDAIRGGPREIQKVRDIQRHLALIQQGKDLSTYDNPHRGFPFVQQSIKLHSLPRPE